MNDQKLTQMLLHFRKTSLLPALEAETDKRIFRELQRYYLVRLNSRGEWIITRKGEEALNMGVKKFIKAEKFENQLAKEAPRLKRQKNILMLLVALLLCFFVFLVVSSPQTLIGLLD
ncbi:hypothetical protein NE848_05965 [Gramella jeungdoensis]|uniref:Uncharacterized protein n=1 Tax=Gramella jeungdoensis TaxID=708091 RepID=A0ABT0Z008_9FLAO|nr:hypothetical protein [Gramella jeungdoensis]MCM8568914.1 hypothetical protein [Gramella jeungdoensis]